MNEPDQYAEWRHALAGHIIDPGAKGAPPSGFFCNHTRNGLEAIAIWRDDDGTLKCKRSIYGDGSKMTPDEIDELFAACCRYPISYEIYVSVTKEGKPWPVEYQTRLSRDEIKNGVPWTPELGRAKLGLDVEPDRDQSTLIGHNRPPDDLTPDQVLANRIAELEAGVEKWLAEVGGVPRNKAEADTLANYAVKFADFRADADAKHKTEKEPHLAAGRAVDSKWFPIRDRAAALRKRCLAIVSTWINGENERRAEDARRANEEARRLAEQQARHSNGLPQPVDEVKPEPVKVGSARTITQRARIVWRVSDLPAFAAYLAGMNQPPPDFIEVCDKLANRIGAAGATAPGIERTTVRSAA
jgi:hypothetical protein